MVHTVTVSDAVFEKFVKLPHEAGDSYTSIFDQLLIHTPPQATGHAGNAPQSGPQQAGAANGGALETPDEHRSAARIQNVLLGSLPAAALTLDELKRLKLVQDVIINQHKIQTLRWDEKRNSAFAQSRPSIESQFGGPLPSPAEEVLSCPSPDGCKVSFPKGFTTSLSNHLTKDHGWTASQIAAQQAIDA